MYLRDRSVRNRESGDRMNEYELETFWRFVHERHSIWHRRFILKQPYPWTEDPVLLKNKFTNIYRELDPGTQFSIHQIMERNDPRPDRIFNVMMYRLMCSIPTYEGWGFKRLDQFSEQEFDDYLCDIYNSGKPVFGNAYLISPYSTMGSEYKFRNVSRLFGMLHRSYEQFYNRLIKAESLKAAYMVINSQYGFGPFLAYQVCVDLLYPLQSQGGESILPFSHDDWAKLGPGALRGFARISEIKDTLGGLKILRYGQRKEFERLGLEFPFLRNDRGEKVEISLANMQNCLCEFHKYRSIQDGTGKSQRLYIPGER